MADFHEDPASRIEALIGRLERRIRVRFLEQLALIRDQTTIRTIQRLILEGNLEGVVEAVNAVSAARIGATGTQAYVTSGQEAAAFISGALNVAVDFDQINFRAVQAMQANQLRLVNGFTQTQTQVTRRALIDGIERGINPRAIAREIKDSIGLTPRQLQFVQNYRRALESGDLSALDRRLRDARFDRTVRSAFADGRALTRDQVDKMVGRYRQRWIAHRATVISRTEALRSAHEGTQEMYRQGIESGLLNPETLVRRWIPTPDDRTRDPHRAEGMQTIEVVGVDTPFITGLGSALLHPGDTSFGAPAEDVIQCRCALTTRFQAAQNPAVAAA